MKQSEDPLKGDWYSLLLEDFKFIGLEIDEEDIKNTPKTVYKKKIKSLIRIAAFKEMNSMKTGKKKVRDINYQRLEVQEYLIDPDFSTEKKKSFICIKVKNAFS